MRTSAIFDSKTSKFFEIYSVSARTRGRGVKPVRTFCEQGGKGSIFRDFVRTSFMDDLKVETNRHSIKVENNTIDNFNRGATRPMGALRKIKNAALSGYAPRLNQRFAIEAVEFIVEEENGNLQMMCVGVAKNNNSLFHPVTIK